MKKGTELAMQVSGYIARLKLNPEIRRNLLLIAKEALHNVAKYSQSEIVKVRIDIEGQNLLLEVSDKDKGFDISMARQGNGLQNMRSRAEKVGGKCEIVSEIGHGTRVVATIPLKK